MWTIQYKPKYYISGTNDGPECRVQYSPSGYGYEWMKLCKSLQAAKIAITKHAKAGFSLQD